MGSAAPAAGAIASDSAMGPSDGAGAGADGGTTMSRAGRGGAVPAIVRESGGVPPCAGAIALTRASSCVLERPLTVTNAEGIGAGIGAGETAGGAALPGAPPRAPAAAGAGTSAATGVGNAGTATARASVGSGRGTKWYARSRDVALRASTTGPVFGGPRVLDAARAGVTSVAAAAIDAAVVDARAVGSAVRDNDRPAGAAVTLMGVFIASVTAPGVATGRTGTAAAAADAAALGLPAAVADGAAVDRSMSGAGVVGVGADVDAETVMRASVPRRRQPPSTNRGHVRSVTSISK